MEYRLVDSALKHQGRVFDIRVDRVQLPNGVETELDIVVHNGAVTILAMESDGALWMVKQYRHPAARQILEVPAGAIDGDETPEACAQRELREEVGLGARSLERIGGFFLAPGYSTEYMHIFLATDLFPDRLPGDEDEILEVQKHPLDTVLALAVNGEILDSKTLAALFLLQHRLSLSS